MRKTMAIGVVLSLILCLSGCGKQAATAGDSTTANSSLNAVYSNLAGQNSKNEVAMILENDQLPKEQTEKVLNWVDDFNKITQSYELKDVFQKLPEKGVDYSTLMLDDTAESYSYLQWLNCRLTAYSLLKDQIETKRTGTDLDTWLMFDIEAIDTVPQFQMSKDERADFITLFNQVSVSGTKTVEEHEKKIVEAWKERDIKIATDQVSLVCVYMHAPEDEARFVGHTGILAEKEDGFMFFEKYSNLAPFQATYFKTKEELKTYLLSRADLYGDEKELDPIVMENGEVL